MSMMGEMTFFLGLQVNQSLSGIFINQSNYVNEILKKYGLNTCDIIGTPMDIKDKLDLDQVGTPVDGTKYRSMIGALMYLTSSRPNIVHATCVCARYQAHPTEKHLKEVKRIFRYLRGTVNMGLWYMKDSGFKLTGFSYADYAGCKDTFKSTSGGIQFLGEKLVSWSSKKQDCTSLSTAESEYVSLSSCCAQVLWMRTQLTDYGYHFDKILIYCDSKSAIAIFCNPVQHSRMKHIAVRYHFIKEHVEKGTIELYFVKTDYQLTDIFTKVLPVDRFNYLVRRLDTMVDANVNAHAAQAPTTAPPTRTDDQILPHIRWRCPSDHISQQQQSIFSPPSSDALINFVNELGYSKLVRNLSNVVTNDMFQAWGALTTIINLCLTGKTSGFERLRAPVLQILWGRKHKFHPRPDSPLHLPNEELVLRYLKFSAKGTKKEVFEMPITSNLITADIQGLVSKQRKPISSLRLVDESVAEGIPEKEPRVDDEESNVQRELEESLKSIYDVPRGPLPSVVIRELESEKYQPLSEVQGKGKEKVTEEHVAHDLLTLHTPKKKSLLINTSFKGAPPYLLDPLAMMNLREGQARPNPNDQDEGQVGPNPDEQAEGQAGPNPDDTAASQPLPSHVVHAGPKIEHMDFEVADVSTQPHPKQMDDGFTTTAYPKVQENLKLTVEEHVILEEPTSSTGTLSSLQHLTKDLSFGDRFFNDKPSVADNEKTTEETKAESMVSITIQLNTSAIPPMTTPVVDLTSRPESPNVHHPLQAMATETTTTTTTPPSQPQQSTTDFMLMKNIDELEHIMANLIQENKHLEERLDSHGARLYTLESLDIPHQRRDSPKTPPGSPPHQPHPPPPPAGSYEASGSLRASGSSQVMPPPPSTNQGAEYQAWTTTDTRIKPSVSLTHANLQMDYDMAPDSQAQSSDDEDIGNAYIPKNNWASALASTYSPPLEDSLLVQTGDIAMFIDWFYKRQGITELKPQDLEGPAFELVKVFHPNVIYVQYQMEECHKLLTDSMDDSILRHNVSKPLPLGGPPGQSVDIEKVVVCSSLRSLKPKCTIESRAKRSSKIISLGHYSIMLASSHTMKSKTDIKSPTYYPCGIIRTSE
nr:copia protein [Tanacetum cinerariifolium]